MSCTHMGNLRSTNKQPNDKPLSGPHKFSLGKYSSCDFCGLVPLKNPISQICVRAGCGYANNPEYKRWIANGRRF